MSGIDFEHILAQDLSVGTETFRESLLQRCLGVIAQNEQGIFELDDNQLDMLAAAGNIFNDDPTQNEPLRRP